jgi:hypothetical protein
MDSLQDSDISAITDNAPGLRCLNLGGCFRLTDDAVELICDNLPNLVHLNIATTKVTDAGLAEIGEKLRWMATLNIFCCASITDEGVKNCVRGLQHLTSANVRGAGDPVFTFVIGATIKRVCQRDECEVLTGNEKYDALY